MCGQAGLQSVESLSERLKCARCKICMSTQSSKPCVHAHVVPERSRTVLFVSSMCKLLLIRVHTAELVTSRDIICQDIQRLASKPQLLSQAVDTPIYLLHVRASQIV